ncbi:hypothetical protein SAMN04488519_104137 [Algoriphagus ornithinivorans]|uniref:Natural product n=1 Tax=Algoriphagus ornithinivorans TaxID=226506 RepID=A0A1I5EZ40_9BACT|nr:hypothetical protein [Algoriphagus ornithinivorans]SFO16765.1 hypothetical protein SAMN04488519_104137 [Algoriphagus ornithinivorans]
MKKLSLEMLRLSTNEVLERSQMKKITGGYGNCTYMACHCTDGGAGSWTGYYCSGTEVTNATRRYCASSGVCN